MAKPRLPRASKNSATVVLDGGPWHGHATVLPRQAAHDPLSLPIRVGEHVGRYNLNTGVWVALEQPGE